VCEGSETCANCPLDCGNCNKDFCGNGVCSRRRESCTTCARDCCPAPPCTAPSDCPTTGNECLARTCVAGVCGTSFVEEGNPTSVQVPGDCKTIVCNGAGGTEEVASIDDFPPADMNPCTESACSDGVPSQQPSPVDTNCGGSNFCDGSGNCVQCTTDVGGMVSCAPFMNECMTAVCSTGICGTTFPMQGTPVSMQTAGDCQRNVCDGMGGTQPVADDLDVPADDGNPCTFEVCSMGAPAHPLAPDGTSCVNMGMSASGTCIMGTCYPPP
jgi:hypothetical protein